LDQRQVSFVIRWDVEGEGEEEVESLLTNVGKPSFRTGPYGKTIYIH
jgi:hypothetical protein